MFGRVVPFEALREAVRLGWFEGRVQRGRGVRTEIVLNQNDLAGVWKVPVRQIPKDGGVIGGGMAVGYLDMRQPSSGANNMKILAVPLRSYS